MRYTVKEIYSTTIFLVIVPSSYISINNVLGWGLISLPNKSTILSNFRFGFGVGTSNIEVIFPLPFVLIRSKSLSPFPGYSVNPIIIYPPSDVSCKELAISTLDPPKVLFHSSVPLPSVLIR